VLRQLTLDLGTPPPSTFDNFFAGANAELVTRLRELDSALAAGPVADRTFYIWGEAGSGRTHLLQALVHEAPRGHARFAGRELRDALVHAVGSRGARANQHAGRRSRVLNPLTQRAIELQARVGGVWRVRQCKREQRRRKRKEPYSEHARTNRNGCAGMERRRPATV